MAKASDSSPSAPIGRRIALQAGVAGAVLAGLPASGAPTEARADVRRGRAPADPRDRALASHGLSPLDDDSLRALRACEAAGVRVLDAYAPRHGGLPFVVEIVSGHADVGGRRTFELVRDDAAMGQPMARVGALALLLRNRGDGGTPSDQDDARLALRIAEALRPQASLLEALPLASPRTRSGLATLHVPLDGEC